VDRSIALAWQTCPDPTVPPHPGSGTGMVTKAVGAAALLRQIGLMADGPVRWGRPVHAAGPGVYIVELGAPLADAPIDLAKVGKWLEKVDTLRLDGGAPTSKTVAARLASFWRPDATILFAGATSGSVGGRVRALTGHALGDRRPHADGHWLQTLRGIDDLRVWWAATTAPEEALDGALDAFAASGPGQMPGRPAGALDLPWANLRRPTGERQEHGITGSLVPEEAAPATPARRVVDLPPGNADGTSTELKGTGTLRRTQRATPAGASSTPAARATAAARTARAEPRTSSRAAIAARANRKPEEVALTAEAINRMRSELDELTRVRRPDVVARIKAARELGDLKENSDYHAAREEQSFLEGRVRLLEDRLRHAVVIEEPVAGEARGRVVLGSTVKVEQNGDELTFTIVGTTEANPAAGRISTASPVGAALLGAKAGDDVEVRTPRGMTRYTVTAVE
jgi:transcription elongation factor GreA